MAYEVSFSGQFCRLHDAVLLPRPNRPAGPPILIGGGRLVLPLVARYADECNLAFDTAAGFARLNQQLDALLQQDGRSPSRVRRSFMTGLVFGRDDAEVGRKVSERGRTVEELLARGLAVGTGVQVVDQLGRLAEAGVQRVMLQWLDLDDRDGLEALAQAVETSKVSEDL